MPTTRRVLLRNAGALAGLAAGGGTASAAPGPPKEAYQPQATKNWWYTNAHLFSPDGEPLYDVSAAFIADHGGDAAGHLMLFTLVDYETGDTTATAVEGLVEPSTERYAATFSSPEATGRVRRTGADPFTFDLEVSVEGVDLSLTYATDYARKTRENYREGGGTANVLFWNQARCSGTIATPRSDGDRRVAGVGFLEHVWGSWSRVPQKGIDFVNGHIGRPGRGDGLPTDASIYFRRTFYHGAPEAGTVLEDVGPVLYLTRDGRTWYVTESVTCTFDGHPCEEHRTGTPDRGRIRGTFADDGSIDVRFDQRRHATVRIPEHESLGNVHEGAADLCGHLTFPGERGRRPVDGLAQTEHQRFGPQYPY